MSVNTQTAGYPERAPRLTTARVGLFLLIGRLARGAVRFMQAFQAAQIVAHRAERYYAMSEQELARIGLNRRDVPAALRRDLFLLIEPPTQ
jgi:hypothetical protein